MVGFIHVISYEELKVEIDEMMKKNNVRLFVIDTFRRNENTEYKYSHNGDELFGGKYRMIKKSRGFVAANNARRYIECWERIV